MSYQSTATATQPIPKPLRFRFDKVSYTPFFEKVTGGNELATNLILTPPSREDYKEIGVKHVLRNEKGTAPYFHTGLIPVIKDYYFGNHYIEGKRHLVIIWIPPSESKMVIKYYPNWFFTKEHNLKYRINKCIQLIELEKKRFDTN